MNVSGRKTVADAESSLASSSRRRARAGRDDQHRTAGDADQAVRDAAEKCGLEPPTPARADDDQLGILVISQIGEPFGREPDDYSLFGVGQPARVRNCCQQSAPACSCSSRGRRKRRRRRDSPGRYPPRHTARMRPRRHGRERALLRAVLPAWPQRRARPESRPTRRHHKRLMYPIRSFRPPSVAEQKQVGHRLTTPFRDLSPSMQRRRGNRIEGRRRSEMRSSPDDGAARLPRFWRYR